MEGGGATVPLTGLQEEVLAQLARSRGTDGYLAGGTALHLSPASHRFSDDIDFFHDSVKAVAVSYERDRRVLEDAGYHLEVLLSQPGFVRVLVKAGDQATTIDWAHDSAWRFMPLVRLDKGGFALHEVDLAINKVLTLAGRDEARDFVDTLHAHQHILPLGAMIWGAIAKDPGFTPASLLEQLKRRGRYQPEDIARLALATPLDLVEAKATWRAALSEANKFIHERPHNEVGCLYYSPSRDRFVSPSPAISLKKQGLVRHFGRPEGILPRVANQQGPRQ